MIESNLIESNLVEPNLIDQPASERPIVSLQDRAWMLAADALHLSMAGCLMGYLLFAGTDVSTTWCVVCSILLLITLVRSGGWIVLIAIQVGLFLREDRSFAPEFELGQTAYVLATLALLAYANSFHTLRVGLRRWLAGQMKSAEAKAWSNWRARGVLRLMVLVVLSIFFFLQLPVSRPERDLWFERSIILQLQFWPGPGMIMAIVSVLVILAVLSARRMTPAQARMFLRSWMVTEHFRDMRRIIKLQWKRESK